jgi:hypothetical protein
MLTLNQLTKIASGSLAIATLAGVGIVSSPANAAITYNCPDGSTNLYCRLSDLVDPNFDYTILANDKLFSEFDQTLNLGDLVDPSAIRVTGFDDNPLTPEFDPGLLFTDFGNTLKTTPGGILDYHFRYRVDVTDPAYWITDNYLKEFEGAVTPGTLPPNGKVEVHEFVYEDLNYSFQALGIPTPLEGVSPRNEKDVVLEWEGTSTPENAKIIDQLDFLKAYKTLFIQKEITLTANGDTIVEIDQFAQSFSQSTPEPGTILGLLAVGGAGLLTKLKKQK